jgi:hypothetical protein
MIPFSDARERGYHRTTTSFDGKFSVRIFVPENQPLTSGSLQIKSNALASVDIMWSGLTVWTGIEGLASNRLTLRPNEWSGRWGTASIFVIEQRNYIWTTTDVNDKTVYHLTLMIGSSNASNLTGMTNISMKIEQIHAN